MAKPRKSKNEDPKASVVLHQKLCLNIDMDSHRIFGHTELKMLVPDGGFVALFADDMSISSVTVDGEPAEYEHFPHFQKADDDERKWSSVSCCNTAADAASRSYMSALEKELAPNLLISCRNLKRDLGGGEGQEDKGSIVQNSSGEQVVNGNGNCLHSEDKNVRWVRVVYWIERAEAGVHFGGNMMHTNNQIRRARSWFPCVDNSSQRCTFDMEFTVGTDFVAVSNGNLLYQVLSKDDPSRKTFVYKLSVPICAEWISLAVGRFEILPDSHSDTISHMCLSPNLSKLQNTVGFFHQAFSHYEDYLATSFPFGSYKQIFIQPEVLISSTSLGASMCIFSSHLLFDEKVIDQTIETRIKLAYALARQWFGVYITAEDPTDEWLVEGLAGFLTDSFIKKFLGNNEARYRRYKANCVVSKADISGATALSSSAASSELYGTQSIGLHGKIRSWKAVAVLQMLEKQMGPDSFRKILQNIVYKAFDMARFRTLSTKEFNNLAYKVGNLERPFLKEFFPSWVESCGCPVLRMGLSYIKRKNMIEVAVMRGCSAKAVGLVNGSTDNGSRDGDAGWPGMMSIRVHELDGMYDHPSLPLAGDTWQLLEIQCHSKLASKRIQKPKKGSKPDGSDDNADTVQNLDMRSSMDSPLLWIRVDPDMEYLAEIHFHQPVQMWINQLEKDKDVVAQAQAIATLEKLPQLSFAVVNALNNFLSDSKAFWRVRIEAAYALAHTASEDTDWAGLLHLIKFYKNRRFDPDIGLPRPNDFHDVPEYFVLEAIPHAIAVVKASDKKSPREAVEFVLQLLKYNDNSGNPYSDVFWLSALVQSVGELDFGQQSVSFLSSLLKHIDRLLQFDSLMPSYNGILTISCIRTLAQIALKLSSSVPMERIFDLIKPFRSGKSSWEVRIESSKVLLDLEFYCRGLDATLSLFMEFLEDEPSLRGETKLAVHVMHLCQVNAEESEVGNDVTCQTLVSLLCMLSGKKAFNNIFLRHRLYCIIQIVAGRPPTLYGVPKIQEPMDNKASLEAHSSEQLNFVPKIQEHMMVPAVEAVSEQQLKPASSFKLRISIPQEPPSLPAATSNLYSSNAPPPPPLIIFDASNSKEADTVSNCSERRKNILKIKVKQPGSSSRADDGDHSRGGLNEANNETVGPASSVSVDAPNQDREANEPSNVRHYQNTEEVNSCRDYESWRTWRTTTSIGSSAKLNATDDDGIRELQCTADSMNRNTIRDNHENDGDVEAVNQIQDQSTPGNNDVEVGGRAPSLLVIGGDDEAVHQMLDQSTPGNNDVEVGGRAPSLIVMGGDEEVTGKRKKEKKKDKEKKRRREKEKSNDPEYLERKRQKKEKKRMEKELATKLKQQNAPSDGKSSSLNDYSVKLVGESSSRKGDPSSLDHEPKKLQGNIDEDHSSRLKVKETTPARKFKIKFKSGVGNV